MSNQWPAFDVESDAPTIAFLHLASQMPGKLRVAHAPWVNHGWHVTLHPAGGSYAIAPIAAGDGRSFSVALDLVEHGFALSISDGTRDLLAFEDGMSIAKLHRGFVAMLDRHGLPSSFDGRPNELEDAKRFDEDDEPRAYNRDSADRLRDAMARIVPVFEHFRAGFAGKSSPVHFFWGSFDLAVTRFSGREAPPHPGGIPGLPDRITREAYSHEVSSAGFWPGNAGMAASPIFYCYAYPEPDGFREAKVTPDTATYNEELGEFVMPYDEVRKADDPEAMLLGFLQSSYEAAANLADWDRKALEREPVAP